MTPNLFQLEQQMRTEVATRQQAAAQNQQVHSVPPPLAGKDTRILLRAGRLLLTWTPR
jgi:hypothetical protein